MANRGNTIHSEKISLRSYKFDSACISFVKFRSYFLRVVTFDRIRCQRI